MGFELTTLVVIGTDCIGSCKSNYHAITTMMAPKTNGSMECLHFNLSELFCKKKEQVIDMICPDVTYCHIKLFETILN